ncbi:MAG: hypothetical protein C0594_01935 [Marinilabiliales bacterium]|nr:MAG: hypothetical protein C0594_01935 [Marinilabiliales bacterium]
MITDNAGCIKSDTIDISQPSEIVLSSTITDAACYGEKSGSISVAVTADNDYTIAWSNGETTANIDSLAAGDYTISVTDETGCTTSTILSITEPVMPLVSQSTTTYDPCNGSEQEISLSVFGGTPEYSYNWSNGDTLSILSIADSTITQYQVTVTDANLCATLNVFQVHISSDSMDVANAITDESCAGKQDGTISLEVLSGTAPYAYTWEDGSTDATLTGLSGGSYTVTITDANNCSYEQTYIINGSADDCLIIYNIITPDGNGKNDLWEIGGISEFPNCKVEVFNQWGVSIYSNDGYAEPWDGTMDGEVLPSATYYYVIDLYGDGSLVKSGSLTIMK